MLPKAAYLQQLKSTFPGLANQPLETLVADNLLSPFSVELPATVIEEARESIAALFRLRENPLYQKAYTPELAALGLKDPGNKSICMSYDFHVTPDHHLKLIEVNTNASFLPLGYEMYRSQGLPLPVDDFTLDEIRTCIESELKLNGKNTPPKNVAIIDETPEQQRLFIEFLVFQELFTQWGWHSKILDYRELDSAATDFVYNRTTDFYFNNPESSALKAAFLNRQVCFSPNPFEYFLLADKQRMIDWSVPGNLASWNVSAADQALIQAVVPKSVSLDVANKEEVWGQRKTYFLKPKRAFGSKQSYKGASVSRKIFDEIAGQEFVAQELVPAPEQVFNTPDGEQSFKYDLRCYAYQGRLQLIVARLYQGQVTNLRTPLGGFGCIKVRSSI